MNDTALPPLPPDLKVEEAPRWADGLARKEERLWPDEEMLKGVKNRNDIWWHTAYGVVVIVLMVFVVLVFMASLGVWVWHQITPHQFLTPDQLGKIQSVIFSGSLGAIVSGYLQKQLTK
jgi:hypothetical protein